MHARAPRSANDVSRRAAAAAHPAGTVLVAPGSQYPRSSDRHAAAAAVRSLGRAGDRFRGHLSHRGSEHSAAFGCDDASEGVPRFQYPDGGVLSRPCRAPTAIPTPPRSSRSWRGITKSIRIGSFSPRLHKALRNVPRVFAQDGEVVTAREAYRSVPTAAGKLSVPCHLVPLDSEFRHDLAAIAAAINGRTRAVVICLTPTAGAGAWIEPMSPTSVAGDDRRVCCCSSAREAGRRDRPVACGGFNQFQRSARSHAEFKPVERKVGSARASSR